MSTGPRPPCARTSLRHTDPTHVQASATVHKLLDEKLKAQEFQIAINRKAQSLPILTKQDFSALAEHRKKADRDAQLAVTLAAVETLDTEELLEEPRRPWHHHHPQVVDGYPTSKRFKYLIHLHNSQDQDATQGPARH